jgi:hypothetical protein
MITITLNIWALLYLAMLTYTFYGMFLVFSVPTWPKEVAGKRVAGTAKTHGELLGTIIFGLVPIINVIMMTAMLAMSGHYDWLSAWMDAPLQPDKVYKPIPTSGIPGVINLGSADDMS